MIPNTGRVKVGADSSSERCNDRLQLIVAKNLLLTSFLYVEHLPPQRQNCLSCPVSTLLRTTACRISLNNENLTFCRILFGTVGEFSGEPGPFTVLSDTHTGVSSSESGFGGQDGFFQNGFDHQRILIEVVVKLLIDHRGYDSLDPGVS